MNFTKHLLTTAAAATALVGMVSAPAQAFQFGASGIKFDTDTTVDFSFKESHGFYWSAFGVEGPGGVKTNLLEEVTRSNLNSGANDWQGTCGLAVTNCDSSFTFKANTTYKFFLDRRKDNGTQVNIANEALKMFNPGDTATVLADTSYKDINTSPSSLLATTNSSASIDPFKSVLIAFEDFGKDNQGNLHVDYNDFMLYAKARTASVPEPTTFVGLGFVAGGLALSRRRNRKVNPVS